MQSEFNIINYNWFSPNINHLSTGNHTQHFRKWENEDAPLMMKREETYEDYQSPYRPRLPKLNTLRRPTFMYNRVPATYHSLLELCDDLPSVDDEKQGLYIYRCK